LGSYAHNRGDDIRTRTQRLQRFLVRHGISLKVLPGADVRVEPDLVSRIRQGEVVTLADHGRHVLLELPHERYVPLDNVLDSLAQHAMTGILSHPERNQGLLREPETVSALVRRGCLMQVTAASLMGTYGTRARDFAEQMLSDGNVHFVATDAHGPKTRRPFLRPAFERVCCLAGDATAIDLFCRNPAYVAEGRAVLVRPQKPRRNVLFSSWFGRRKAG
jgi:protein-tyrosine phosphatase